MCVCALFFIKRNIWHFIGLHRITHSNVCIGWFFFFKFHFDGLDGMVSSCKQQQKHQTLWLSSTYNIVHKKNIWKWTKHDEMTLRANLSKCFWLMMCSSLSYDFELRTENGIRIREFLAHNGDGCWMCLIRLKSFGFQ